jgi:hypothetical protein
MLIYLFIYSEQGCVVSWIPTDFQLKPIQECAGNWNWINWGKTRRLWSFPGANACTLLSHPTLSGVGVSSTDTLGFWSANYPWSASCPWVRIVRAIFLGFAWAACMLELTLGPYPITLGYLPLTARMFCPQKPFCTAYHPCLHLPQLFLTVALSVALDIGCAASEFTTLAALSTWFD